VSTLGAPQQPKDPEIALPPSDTAAATSGSRRPDLRRSVRVSLSGFPVELVGCGRALLTNLSLGGARVVCTRRLQPGERDWIILEYDHQWAAAEVEVRQVSVSELYYDDASRASRVRYAARMVFCNPSVDSLNTLYRILNEVWNPEASDDDALVPG